MLLPLNSQGEQTYTEFILKYTGTIVYSGTMTITYDNTGNYICNTSLLGYEVCLNSVKHKAKLACMNKGVELTRNRQYVSRKCTVSEN